MADPIRLFLGWPGTPRQRFASTVRSGLVYRQDSLRMAVHLIARHELRCWFEPDWANARYLARRFPHCMICSIPVESNTENLHRIPAWRSRPGNGAL